MKNENDFRFNQSSILIFVFFTTYVIVRWRNKSNINGKHFSLSHVYLDLAQNIWRLSIYLPNVDQQFMIIDENLEVFPVWLREKGIYKRKQIYHL